MQVVYEDGSWFVGERTMWDAFVESHNCHHFKVKAGSAEFLPLVGQKVAVELSKPKYFVLNVKRGILR